MATLVEQFKSKRLVTKDMIACKKCKIDVIGVTWGLDTKNLLSSAGPAYLIEQPHEIINAVTEI
jgi:phosphoglycolate phosphatase